MVFEERVFKKLKSQLLSILAIIRKPAPPPLISYTSHERKGLLGFTRVGENAGGWGEEKVHLGVSK